MGNRDQQEELLKTLGDFTSKETWDKFFTIRGSDDSFEWLIRQTQKFFMESNDCNDERNIGFQFAGKAVYTAVWVAVVSLFVELLGFSTQKWLTARALGTVLITLAGREIFTNFLSSVMIYVT
ncbi:hypothetical protein LOK49_LG01G02682 [Camellia lanceoleosa]|uniref:Uncharacterized protein n=1 Tax=Camellia lanceoleosa TaxID=1840588 RepID=A0ACC0J4T7_9ERIC|nr:hypothetical protein LOK49_LG01G02682 [Camellia lanceoleosa]